MQIGDTYEYKNVVTKEITAGALGSGGLDIFATPFLICWMEAAAYYYMKEQLPEGKSSVGTMVNVRHVSPSPIGAEITAKAELIAISENGKMYTFKVEAYDNKGLIGEGTHERAIIDCERFKEEVPGQAGRLNKQGGSPCTITEPFTVRRARRTA